MNTLLAATTDQTNWAALAIPFVLWGVIVLVSYQIGADKGRGAAGFWLGLCLGLIGLIIVACMQPSYEVSLQRQAERERALTRMTQTDIWGPPTTGGSA